MILLWPAEGILFFNSRSAVNKTSDHPSSLPLPRTYTAKRRTLLGASGTPKNVTPTFGIRTWFLPIPCGHKYNGFHSLASGAAP